MPRRSFAGLLLFLLVVSVPLAYANPPEESWSGGWYNDDSDDSAFLITGVVATLDVPSVVAPRPSLVIVGVVHLASQTARKSHDVGLVLLRAPPAFA